MKTIKIKRREILKAIRTEPLRAGTWIEEKEKEVEDETGVLVTKYESDKTCKVCAVGAVLRQKGVPDNQIFWAADSLFCYGGSEDEASASDDGDPFEELKKGNYMAALSCKFEQLSKRLGSGKRTRETLIRFVKRHFPKQITAKFEYKQG